MGIEIPCIESLPVGESMHRGQVVGPTSVTAVQGTRTCWWQWLDELGQPHLSSKRNHWILVDWK